MSLVIFKSEIFFTFRRENCLDHSWQTKTNMSAEFNAKGFFEWVESLRKNQKIRQENKKSDSQYQ